MAVENTNCAPAFFAASPRAVWITAVCLAGGGSFQRNTDSQRGDGSGSKT